MKGIQRGSLPFDLLIDVFRAPSAPNDALSAPSADEGGQPHPAENSPDAAPPAERERTAPRGERPTTLRERPAADTATADADDADDANVTDPVDTTDTEEAANAAVLLAPPPETEAARGITTDTVVAWSPLTAASVGNTAAQNNDADQTAVSSPLQVAPPPTAAPAAPTAARTRSAVVPAAVAADPAMDATDVTPDAPTPTPTAQSPTVSTEGPKPVTSHPSTALAPTAFTAQAVPDTPATVNRPARSAHGKATQAVQDAAAVGDAAPGHATPGDAARPDAAVITPSRDGGAATMAIPTAPAASGQPAGTTAGGGSSSAIAAAGSMGATGSRSTAAATTSGQVPARQAADRVAVTEQVRVHVKRALMDGSDRIEIHLKPARLGRLEIRLDLGRDGQVQATVTADNRHTLDLLRADARGLERALQDAGLRADAGGLNFNLRGDGSAGGGPQQQQHADTGPRETTAETTAPAIDESASVASALGGQRANGRVDIRA